MFKISKSRCLPDWIYILAQHHHKSSYRSCKVPIGCTGWRHSWTFLPNLNSMAIVGGITCDEDGTCVRQKLAVVLVNISTWFWTEFKISDDLFLSSTKRGLHIEKSAKQEWLIAPISHIITSKATNLLGRSN